MDHSPDIEDIYTAIGQFVVFFQMCEDTYREIGWLIVDPERRNWPPRQFRRQRTVELIEDVTNAFINLTSSHTFPNGEEKAREADELRRSFHALRNFRNRILHSVYTEIVVDKKVVEITRTNPRTIVDPETGDVQFDQEPISPETITNVIAENAVAVFKLFQLKTQLVHWNPYARYASDE